ncbi:MAG: T9SS type A sorting domain-containing protein [Bacteroidota bacterium]
MKKFYFTLISFVLISFTNVSAQTTHYIDVTDYGSPSNSGEFNATGYSIDGQAVEYNGCTGVPSIHVAIIDSISCLPLTNCNKNLGQANIFYDPNGDCISDINTTYTCRSRAESYFIFRSNDVAQMQSLSHLLDSCGNGNYILVYTFMPSVFSTIDSAFSNSLQRLGSTLITTLPDNFPFIFYCKKGDAGSVQETSGTAPNSMITLNASYQCAANGIADITSGSAPVIYPNPASDEFNIAFGNHQQPLQIGIYDGTGRLLLEKSVGNNSEIINVKNLAEGFYYVRVASDNYNANAKICLARQ